MGNEENVQEVAAIEIQVRASQISNVLLAFSEDHEEDWCKALRDRFDGEEDVEFHCPLTGCNMLITSFEENYVTLRCNDSLIKWEEFLIAYGID